MAVAVSRSVIVQSFHRREKTPAIGKGKKMTIEKNVSGPSTELMLSGWLDTMSASELEAALNELSPDVTELVFDCSGLEYISSAGLRQFVAAHKKMKGALTIRHVSEEIMGVIRITELDKWMRFE